MSRSSTLIVLAILIIIAPLSGLPISFRTLVAIACGAGVLAIGLRMRTESSPVEPTPESNSAPATSASIESPVISSL